MAKATKKAKSAKRDRIERRFEPRSTTSPPVVYTLGALGAGALGAGVYGQFIRTAMPVAEPMKFAAWFVAAGAIVLGGAIWIGTSGDPALRVGDGGVAVEKNGVRRIAWHAVESVRYEGASRSIAVRGNDEAGVALTISAPIGSQAQAAAWIVKEARARVPDLVDVGDVELPNAETGAGEILPLEALQIVGRHCAESGKIIAFEPDARVCPQCERVYHKANVPSRCACGSSLTALQSKAKRDAAADEAASEG